MVYERPDLANMTAGMQEMTKQLKEADSYDRAKEVFLAYEKEKRHVATMQELAGIRHTIDTRDAFYDAEDTWWNQAAPQIEEFSQAWLSALLESPFRKELAEEYGELMFTNAEIARKCFSPEIIPLLQRENELVQEYVKLIASAQIDFQGSVYTLAQLGKYKNDPDDEIRLAAWKAEGGWYKAHQADLDRIYDELVKVRDQAGRSLGYDGYTQLGYYRMGRNCYTKEDVEKFREAVRNYVVPVADAVFRRQAERIGKEYPMSFADNVLEFRSGNPRPAGSADDVVAAGAKFYDELSPATSAFFHTMLDNELMDLIATEGKAGGGYCTSIPDYEVPFIFANFNGTQGDVEVVTHEAGHAFAAWYNRSRIPMETVWPSMEGCEVHSMSMEFFGEGWAEDFFGADARKFRYSHLSDALTFIPYGTMVDHFQHIVYEKPQMTPAERHAVWKELLGIYMPWVKLDGEIPFYSEGEGWQRQSHIYEMPFYYIDYCLAQTVSLEFWAKIFEGAVPGAPAKRSSLDNAWKYYMAYTEQGGSRTFTELLANAGLESPFDEACLRGVCEKAQRYLAEYDLEGIS